MEKSKTIFTIGADGVEKIKEMLYMQNALDDAIYTAKNVKYDKAKCYMAMIDEIGEMTHELKSEWCWWKNTQKKSDNVKVLEELVDVWHFVLSIVNHGSIPGFEHYGQFEYRKAIEYDFEAINNSIQLMIAMDLEYRILHTLLCLTYALGFELNNVYEFYINKNRINFQRLREGY